MYVRHNIPAAKSYKLCRDDIGIADVKQRPDNAARDDLKRSPSRGNSIHI